MSPQSLVDLVARVVLLVLATMCFVEFWAIDHQKNGHIQLLRAIMWVVGTGALSVAWYLVATLLGDPMRREMTDLAAIVQAPRVFAYILLLRALRGV